MKKMVSVILPTYNRGKVIKRAVDSILSQTYSFFELIIIDDASQDDTEDVIRQINDLRIRYYKLPSNKGPSYARNYGITQARYDYVAFHDSDDEWLPRKLEFQMNVIEQGADVVYCPYQYVKGDCMVTIPAESVPREKLMGNMLESLYEANKIGTPTLLLSKACLDRVGGFNEKLQCIEDWDLAIRIAQEYKIMYVDEPLVKAYYSSAGVNQRIEEKIKSIQYLYTKYDGISKYKRVYKNIILECLIELNEEERARWINELIPIFFSDSDSLMYEISLRTQIKKLELDCAIQKQLTDIERMRNIIREQLFGKKVAIYGLGSVGISLLNVLKENKVDVVALVDRRKISIGQHQTISVRTIERIKIDKIIITPHMQFQKIKNNIELFTDAECIDILGLLGGQYS